ncbi:MAG TPA: sigma-70 family RNA polymerase sigma factor [Pedobacter sp.]|nr:sigma-70 family RNA polymerase sigma factor [Pedobacter sp.]
MKNLSDSALLSLMGQDNELAFSCLIDRYHSTLFRHLLRRTQSPDDTQEILQDIFISLWNKRKTLHSSESIYPYLFSAAKYEVIYWFVKSERNVRREALLSALKPSISFSAEDTLMATELENLLNIEVAKMPSTMKAIFQLSRNELLSVKEIAERLHISEQTVKNNTSAALKRLKCVLKREDYVIVFLAVLFTLR